MPISPLLKAFSTAPEIKSVFAIEEKNIEDVDKVSYLFQYTTIKSGLTQYLLHSVSWSMFIDKTFFFSLLKLDGIYLFLKSFLFPFNINNSIVSLFIITIENLQSQACLFEKLLPEYKFQDR